MKEIGGYMEMEHFNLPMLHERAIALNTGRNCLLYLIIAKNIKKIYIPYYLCDSVRNICKKVNVDIRYYHIDERFLPQIESISGNEWIYIVNYYGQLTSEDIINMKIKYKNIIVDQAQSYFAEPIEGVDTIYIPRKFFGVSDGAFLYTDQLIGYDLEIDESYTRMSHILGRYECTAKEFYNDYKKNNELFDEQPLKYMSNLTRNLLHAIDYESVKKKRTENYNILHEQLEYYNHLNLHSVEGAFAYPLFIENAVQVRCKLIDSNIYIPQLWPNVLQDIKENTLEYRLTENILPIPCDQRYGYEEMEQICDLLNKLNIK